MHSSASAQASPDRNEEHVRHAPTPGGLWRAGHGGVTGRCRQTGLKHDMRFSCSNMHRRSRRAAAVGWPTWCVIKRGSRQNTHQRGRNASPSTRAGKQATRQDKQLAARRPRVLTRQRIGATPTRALFRTGSDAVQSWTKQRQSFKGCTAQQQQGCIAAARVHNSSAYYNARKDSEDTRMRRSAGRGRQPSVN